MIFLNRIMIGDAMEPFGKALNDYFNGDHDARVVMHRDDGLIEDHPVAFYFRSFDQFPIIEKTAISCCEGKILDLGAGVGPHSLELQQRGYEVDALDISPTICNIMKKRGVINVICSSVFTLADQGKKYDTIFSMGSSIGFVETINGMEKFLNYSRTILNPSGKMLLVANDIRNTNNQNHLNYHAKNRQQGKYIGEIRLQMEYKGIFGEKFQILHIDPDVFQETCKKTGWNFKIKEKQSNSGSYLAEIW